MLLESDLTLQVAQRYQVDSRYLKPPTSTACIHLPIASFPSPVAPRQLSIDLLAGGTVAARNNIPASYFDILGELAQLDDSDLDNLQRLIVVPLSTAEADGFPLLTIHNDALADDDSPSAHGSPRRHLALRVSPIAIISTPGDMNFATAVRVGTDPELDLLAIALHLDLQPLVEIAGTNQLPLSAEYKSGHINVDAVPHILPTLSRELTRIEKRLAETVEWVKSLPYAHQAATHLIRLEELRGRVVALRHSLEDHPNPTHCRALVDDYWELADDLASRSRFCLIIRRDNSAAVSFQRPPCDLERVAIAYSTVGGTDQSRRTWAAGTSASLVISGIVSAMVLLAIKVAEHPMDLLRAHSDPIVTMLAIAPAVLLTQVDRADTTAIYAARRAKGLFLVLVALPLSLPFLGSLLLLWEKPWLGLAESVLAAGAMLGFAATLLYSRWTRRPSLMSRSLGALERSVPTPIPTRGK